ncbi:MAG: transcriptional repressor LexA [Bacillota bacterium]
MAKLSSRQQQIVDYIRESMAKRGYPPSVREICRAVGLKSTSAVHAQLKRLEAMGVLVRDRWTKRAIRLVEDEGVSNLIPLVGKVTAGSPVLAVENIEGYMPVPRELGEAGSHFLLRVKGDSMVGAGIMDGDVLVVRQQDHCQSGDIAVVLLGDEATVKRVVFDSGRVILQPENPAYEKIVVSPDQQFKVLGKVTGLFRKL